MGMKEVIESEKGKVKPIAERNGVKIVDYADAKELSDLEMYAPTPDTGDRTFNPDGSLARTRTLHLAINPERRFNNRYRLKGKLGERKMQIVVDYRALQEQASGRVYLANIPCYEISKGSDGEFKLDRIITVSDSEFISEFTDKLSVELMMKIAPLLEDGASEISETKVMPI